MDFPLYGGRDKAVMEWASALCEWLMKNVPAAAPPTEPFDYVTPTVQITTASNVTITRDQLNCLYVVKNTAAINFTLPEMTVGEWVEVYNDSGSTNNITVKDFNSNTITTVTPGATSKRIIPDITGAYAPL